MDNLRSAIRASALGPVRETELGLYVQSYCFAPDFIGFSGHFPGYPLLPAFVQVLTVLIMAEEVQGRRLQVLTLERAKFQREVFPGHEIKVEYREGITKNGQRKLKAALTVAENPAASFLLTFDDQVE